MIDVNSDVTDLCFTPWMMEQVSSLVVELTNGPKVQIKQEFITSWFSCTALNVVAVVQFLLQSSASKSLICCFPRFPALLCQKSEFGGRKRRTETLAAGWLERCLQGFICFSGLFGHNGLYMMTPHPCRIQP